MSSFPFVMIDGAEDFVADHLQAIDDVLGQETKYEETMSLQQRVLSPISPIGVGFAKMAPAVDLDRDSRIQARKVEFGLLRAESESGFHIQAKKADRLRQALEEFEKKPLRGAAGLAVGL